MFFDMDFDTRYKTYVLSIWQRVETPGYTENRHWMDKVKISLFGKMAFFSLVQTYFWEAVETYGDISKPITPITKFQNPPFMPILGSV